MRQIESIEEKHKQKRRCIVAGKQGTGNKDSISRYTGILDIWTRIWSNMTIGTITIILGIK